MPPLAKIRLKNILLFSWLCLLSACLVFSAWDAHQRTLSVSEYASGCDAFGYLAMAREVRRAAHDRELPRFVVESQQSRLLIDAMKSQNVPVVNWHEMVAPLAARYFPKADHVALQYPPGTALVLSLFPEKRSVHQVNKIVFISTVLLGIAGLAYAGMKRAWISSGFLALTCYLIFQILAEIGNMSFSINALVLPLMIGMLLLFASFHFNFVQPRSAWWIALCAGVVFGLAILIRIPVILLVPGCLVLLWPQRWIPRFKDAVIGFSLGLFCGGIIPLLIHQHRVVGAWYLPTYASADASLPNLNLDLIRSTMSFYSLSGPGGRHNWAVYILCFGLVGLLLYKQTARSTTIGPSWKRIVISAITLWGVSTAFFITHIVPMAYYPVPAVLGAAMFVTFAAYSFETSPAHNRPKLLPEWRWALLFLAIMPGAVTVERVWSKSSSSYNAQEVIYPDPNVPAELMDERAWVWSDGLSGTLWYYAGKTAFKSGWTDSQTREIAYRLAFERGEPQFLIRDRSDFESLLAEVSQLGGSVEMRGEIDSHPYYLIRWPEAGPTKRLTN